MSTGPLSSLGLFFATTASIANVGFDVAAKRALTGRNFLQTTAWIRISVAVLLSLLLAVFWLHASTRSSLVLFRLGLFGTLDGGILPVLLLSTGLVTVSILLYYRSLQVGSISVIAPLFGFTPVFMLGTGYLFFHHLPAVRVIAGVLLILLGSLQAHWKRTMRTPAAAVVTFLREKGVGTMLTACLLLSVTNLLDKWLVTHMDALSYAWLYAVMCALFTSCLLLIPGTAGFSPAGNRRRILLASLLDTTVLLLHFASLQYIDAVVTVAIKRSGMVLSVIAGSFFFGERNARQRLAAACVVLMGVLLMYFDLRGWRLILLVVVALGASVAAVINGRRAGRDFSDAEALLP
jgi:drug/metabolite transporter (DMT)-like permease